MAVKQVQEERNRNKGHTIVEPLLKPSWKGGMYRVCTEILGVHYRHVIRAKWICRYCNCHSLVKSLRSFIDEFELMFLTGG